MGQVWSTGWQQFRHPDVMPKTQMPECFDPMYGFANGRKQREMLATDEDMDRWKVPLHQRDYCAHKAVEFYKCQYENWPWANLYCEQLRHSWEICQNDDQVLRMKEFERERRLLEKELKLKRQQNGGDDQNGKSTTKKLENGDGNKKSEE